MKPGIWHEVHTAQQYLSCLNLTDATGEKSLKCLTLHGGHQRICKMLQCHKYFSLNNMHPLGDFSCLQSAAGKFLLQILPAREENNSKKPSPNSKIQF